MKTNYGFTMVELCITLAVISISLSMGSVAFSTLTSNRVRSASDTIYAALAEARTEALKRNKTIAAVIASDAVTIQDGATGHQIKKETYSNSGSGVNITADTVSFSSTGQEANLSSHTIEVTSSECTVDSTCLRIEVFGGGFVKVCNPSQGDSNAINSCI